MAKPTLGELVALGLSNELASHIITTWTNGSTKTHYKYWVYMDQQMAQQLASMFGDDPKFKLVKYMNVVNHRKLGTTPTKIDID